MIQLAAMDGVLLGERCAACGWLGPREGCGWHGLIAALEELVAGVLEAGALPSEALSVQGPDPRHPSGRTGCVHVRVAQASLHDDRSLRASIEAIAAEWRFTVQERDDLGFWLSHHAAPPSRDAKGQEPVARPTTPKPVTADGDGGGT